MLNNMVFRIIALWFLIIASSSVYAEGWKSRRGIAVGLAEADAGEVKQLVIVDTEWLAKNINDKNIKIVFVQADKKDNTYIPNSILVSSGEFWNRGSGTDFSQEDSAPPTKNQFERIMSSIGITTNDYVVIYGMGNGDNRAARALWVMEYYGHKKISWLYGGFKKWIDEKRETSSTLKEVIPTEYKVTEMNPSVRATGEYIANNLKNPKMVLIDILGKDHYDKGHIPGAILFNQGILMKEAFPNYNNPEKLKPIINELEAKGITKDKEIITYCFGGVVASTTYFVFKHILGYPNTKMYSESWWGWEAKYPNMIEKSQ